MAERVTDGSSGVVGIRLEPWQRLLAGVAGGAALGVGGAAVLVTENQAGSAALILLGGFAWLLALTGRVPDRIGREGLGYDREGQAAIETLKENFDDPTVPEEAKRALAVTFQDFKSAAGKALEQRRTTALDALSNRVIYGSSLLDIAEDVRLPHSSTRRNKQGNPDSADLEIVSTDPSKPCQIDVYFSQDEPGMLWALKHTATPLPPGREQLIFIWMDTENLPLWVYASDQDGPFLTSGDLGYMTNLINTKLPRLWEKAHAALEQSEVPNEPDDTSTVEGT